MKKSYKHLILVLIYRSGGKWTWYQLERDLEWRGIKGKIRVVDIVDELRSEGLVVKNENPKLGPGMPYYAVTDDGLNFVKELIDQFGTEAFELKKESREDYE